MHTAYTSAEKRNRVAVIGGGAAGMMAAVQSALMGAETVLFEKNEKLGKKLYITGKGRCNFTNDCAPDEFMRQVPRNGRFAHSALAAFSPRDMMAFLEEAHCPVKVERGRRAFPVSDKASDVTKAFQRYLSDLKVTVCLNTRVVSICAEPSADGERVFTGVTLEDGRFLPFDAAVIATGGLSYPSTGSTGDGYGFARSLGHEIIPCTPCLTGVETVETWPRDLQGLSLKNIRLTLLAGKKRLYSEVGEMLFTHYGISGPLVIDISSILSGKDPGEFRIELDLKPGLPPEKIREKLAGMISAHGSQQIQTVTSSWFPQRLNGVFLTLCAVPAVKKCAQITSAERNALSLSMKQLCLTPSSLRPFSEAIVTRGGVETRQINASTMESKQARGVYFAGEVVDIDALTGGYNLQLAFSTGYLAGTSAASCRPAGTPLPGNA